MAYHYTGGYFSRLPFLGAILTPRSSPFASFLHPGQRGTVPEPAAAGFTPQFKHI